MKLARTVWFAALAAACQAKSDESLPPDAVAARAPDVVSTGAGWTRTQPPVAPAACEEDSIPMSAFGGAPSAEPPVMVQATSIDTVAGYRIAVLGGSCGGAIAFVRQMEADGPEYLPMPPGFRDGLTSFAFDSAGRHIVFVEFDGQNGAFAVVLSVPAYQELARSPRIEVPSVDTQCGIARFHGAGAWSALMCTDGPNPERYTRVRGRLGDAGIVVDTTHVSLTGFP